MKTIATVVAFLIFGSSAHSLEVHEVERVVGVLEQLAEDLGGLSYDGEATADWFENDALGERRIEAAGFDLAGWREAADSTMRAFYATLSETEIEEAFAAIPDFEDRQDLTDSQKQALAESVAEQRATIEAWRAEGAANAALVQPFSKRVRAALDME
ncbi:hypothetical protein [Arvimicrobium flavum]|uniref:hypothetical protein n=1 Tax=Arvimicrobium flavum TaxID=3393320 RepID=UPI00237A97FF|nr:hypothetical protein [Mesorhizobium shangrilense]